MRSLTSILSVCVALGSGGLDEDLQLLTSRFPGYYSNYLQWEDGVEQNVTKDKAHPLIFSIFHGPVDLPQFGGHVFYVQEFLEGNPSKVYRQRLYSFAADKSQGQVVLSIFRFNDPSKYLDADQHPEKLVGLTEADVYNVRGCEVYIKRSGDVFAGSTRAGACKTVSHLTNRTLRLEDDNVFGEDFVSIHEVGYDDETGDKVFGMEEADVLNRTTAPRLYSGYIAAEGYPFVTGVEIYDSGMQVPVLDAQGQETEWRMELAKVTYEPGDVTVLKLAAHKQGYVHGGKVLPPAYSWTSPDSKKIGINIREIEGGFTLVEPGMDVAVPSPQLRRALNRPPAFV